MFSYVFFYRVLFVSIILMTTPEVRICNSLDSEQSLLRGPHHIPMRDVGVRYNSFSQNFKAIVFVE